MSQHFSEASRSDTGKLTKLMWYLLIFRDFDVGPASFRKRKSQNLTQRGLFQTLPSALETPNNHRNQTKIILDNFENLEKSEIVDLFCGRAEIGDAYIEFMEILGFDPNRESSFSSFRASKEVLLGVPERSFYEVLGFSNNFLLMIGFFFQLIEFLKNPKFFEKSEKISDFRKIELKKNPKC